MTDPYHNAQNRLKESAVAVAIFAVVYLILKLIGKVP